MSCRMTSRNLQVLGAVCLLIVLGVKFSPSTKFSTVQPAASTDLLTNHHKENILDGCRHVYLDMGTNIGIQIRKLFEPQLFPDASMLPIFNKYFGPLESRLRAGTVCAVGWEPNPAHTPVLARLEEAYNRCGWKVKIHTQTGVGARQLETHYEAIDYAKKGDGIGGQLRENAGEGTTSVASMRIAEFINDVVATRRIPKGEGEELPPAVVMKLDVEGKEMEVIPDMLLSGALAHIDTLHVDWHLGLSWQDPEAQKTKWAIEFFTQLGNRYNISHVAQVDDRDDETYGDFSGELPPC